MAAPLNVLQIQRTQASAASVPPMPAIETPEGRTMWLPPDAILTIADVARILDVQPKTVRTMGLKVSYATPHRPYVLYRWLVEYLEARAA
jgi:hypothetical protein